MTAAVAPDTSRAIPVAVQREVLGRDGMTCQWCGITVIRSRFHCPNRLHFDHVAQWSHGGESTVENVVVSCAQCNLARAERGGNIRSPLRTLFAYSHGYYRWVEYVTVPRHLTGVGLALRAYCAEQRVDPVHVVGRILTGRLAATAKGRIYVEYEPTVSRHAGRKRYAR